MIWSQMPPAASARSDCSKSCMAHSSLAGRAMAHAPVIYTPNAARLVRQHRLDRGPFIIAEFIPHDSRLRFGRLHRHDVHQARRAAGEALVTVRQLGPWLAGAALIALPFVYREPYHLHILILILIWS